MPIPVGGVGQETLLKGKGGSVATGGCGSWGEH